MNFQAIKIIHNIIDRVDYYFLAVFFDFCGIYVMEDTINNFNVNKEKENIYDCYIFTSLEEIPKDIDLEKLQKKQW